MTGAARTARTTRTTGAVCRAVHRVAPVLGVGGGVGVSGWCWVGVFLGGGEDLGQVEGFQGCALAAQDAVQVHQAGVVRAAEHVRAGVQGVPDLVLAHRDRHVGVLHRERAAEPAAFLRALQLPQLQTPHGLEQPAGAFAQAQHPQAVAGGVVGHGVREVRPHIGDTQHVHHELRQLIGTRGQRRRRRGQLPAAPFGLGLGAHAGVVVPHHRRARTRRRHDVVVTLERLRHPPHQRLRRPPVPGIELRLPTTRLRRGKVHLHTQPLQQRDHRAAGVRIEQVVHTGHEEGYPHRSSCRPQVRPCCR